MIHLTEQTAKLLKFTPYTEMHGDEPVPGAALRFEVNVGSAALERFHPELRAFLYHRLGAKSHDLADHTASLPDLRFEKIQPPYLWRQRYDDSKLTIHIGDLADHAIALKGRIKKPFAITPMQGGTVVIAFTYNCHPQNGEVGTIYSLQKNTVTISLDPGTEVADDGPDDGGDEESA